MKVTSLLVITITLLIACSSAQDIQRPVPRAISSMDELKHDTDLDITENNARKHPKNIILMIGDGMGITQITAGLYTNDNQLYLEKFKNIGLHKSHSGSKLITDSAAGATAFACGVKTYNGAIGVELDERSHISILEEAEDNGKATGLVASSTIVHATPASFIAHQPERRMYEEIAADFLKTDIDLFIGGGKKYFDRRTIDDRNLYDELRTKGYKVMDYFNHSIEDISVIPGQKFAFLTADDDPIPVLQGRDYLETASMLAIEQLNANSDKGFFLMIEGSQIDWGGHANNSDYLVSELLEFDQIIGSVLKWAAQDKNTLVIVTADHETGGYAINGGAMGALETKFTSTYHTADLIPVFAFGPGSEAFRGIYENTDIYYKMRKAFKFE